jgi:16S rRNA (cytosine1402-N4)-methyltransferase
MGIRPDGQHDQHDQRDQQDPAGRDPAGAATRGVEMPEMPGGPHTAAAHHVPVLRDRCVALLAPALQAPRSVVVDATLGMGGHSEALLTECPAARLVGIDRDRQAIALAGRRLERFGDRVTLVHAVYDALPHVLADLGLRAVQGVLLDLGVSSLQLDEPARGFAYRHDAALDMRMDQSGGMTAADVLNTYPADRLARVLQVYGEERFAKRIAAAVVRERSREPFTTSARLVELVRDSVPAAARRTGGNPAKRTFQALRIEVNGELEALERALPEAVAALAVSGRIVVLSYHSLEDRLAKTVLATGAASTTPLDLPVELPEHAPRLRLLTRGAEQAGEQEVQQNPRAASVRLRAAERLRPDPRGQRTGRAA